MILFEPSVQKAGPFILIVGVGLIGREMADAIRRTGFFSEQFYPFNWTNKSDQFSNLEHLAFGLKNKNCFQLEVVWSAGKAGFSSSQSDIDAEMQTYCYVLSFISEFSSANGIKVGFTLLSSAGGLYEGSRLVDITTPISPSRPYGLLKVKQEEYLMQTSTFFAKRIFRLSSVYGYINPNFRMGLIPTLIINGIQNKQTTICGRASTLRDFIFTQDIGVFLIKNLVYNNNLTQLEASLLAAGKPNSIHEIISLIEMFLSKRLYVQYDSNYSNSSDITYNPNVLPPDWTSSELLSNIRKIIINYSTTSQKIAT